MSRLFSILFLLVSPPISLSYPPLLVSPFDSLLASPLFHLPQILGVHPRGDGTSQFQHSSHSFGPLSCSCHPPSHFPMCSQLLSCLQEASMGVGSSHVPFGLPFSSSLFSPWGKYSKPHLARIQPSLLQMVQDKWFSAPSPLVQGHAFLSQFCHDEIYYQFWHRHSVLWPYFSRLVVT
jgi:hypothetical protein